LTGRKFGKVNFNFSSHGQAILVQGRRQIPHPMSNGNVEGFELVISLVYIEQTPLFFKFHFDYVVVNVGLNFYVPVKLGSSQSSTVTATCIIAMLNKKD
jgi:hypothetical protein